MARDRDLVTIGAPIGNGHLGIKWSRDRWRHVTLIGQPRDPNTHRGISKSAGDSGFVRKGSKIGIGNGLWRVEWSLARWCHVSGLTGFTTRRVNQNRTQNPLKPYSIMKAIGGLAQTIYLPIPCPLLKTSKIQSLTLLQVQSIDYIKIRQRQPNCNVRVS